MEISDTGRGIAPENQHKVFNEIVQFHANAHQGGGGSGLGLWISKKIVELHGGRVGLQSDGEGRGSMFFLEIPVLRRMQDDIEAVEGEDDPEVYNNSSSPRAISSKSSHKYACDNENGSTSFQIETVVRSQFHLGKQLKALVVDDSSINRKFTRKLLENLKYICEEADDGDVAVAMVREAFQSKGAKSQYDIIFMDNLMPRMNGPEAAALIRRMGFTGVIMAVTGNALQADIDEFKRKGADEVLIKPVNGELLKSAVSAYFVQNEK